MMRIALFSLIYSLLGQVAQAQVGAGDTLRQTAAVRQAIGRYEQVSYTPERLFDGPEYISYDRRLTGHAFFPSDTMQRGQIAYEGGQFNVPMLYDIVKDLVVIVHTSGYRIALHSDRVRSFSLAGHSFIRVDSSGQGLSGGFYDLLYNGPTQLLARRAKTILVSPSSFGYGQYNSKTVYYLRKNGQYFPVKTRRALLNLLDDRRRQLTTYLRQQKIRFKSAPETALLTLARHYDDLNKPL